MVVLLAPSVAMTGINMRAVYDRHLSTLSRRHRSGANLGVGQRMALASHLALCPGPAWDVRAREQDPKFK